MKNVLADGIPADRGGAPQLTGAAKARQRDQEHGYDQSMHSASGEEQGANPRPTRAPLQSRSASPAAYNTSGMESAMGAAADKLHPVRQRGK